MKKQKMPTKTVAICFFLLILNPFSGKSQSTPINSQDTISIPDLRFGRLSNGFTYFIKDLAKPQPKLYLRLYHKAGSNEEDPDQFEIAHGVEHLAFKSTKNFPNGIGQSEPIKRLGISKYDMLAYSGRATEYYFDAPQDSQEALETAFLWFKDIANGLSLTDEDINSVKGELRQELLRGGGNNFHEWSAKNKLRASFFPCQKEGSNLLENIKTQTPEVFRRFYRDWYRPDLLAISIVGNIENMDSLEEQIKNSFSDLKPADNPRNLIDCNSLFANRPPQFSVIERTPITSKRLPDTKVNLEILFRDPITMKNLGNLIGIKRLILMQMLRRVASERLNEITTDYSYGSFSIGLLNTYDARQRPSSLKINATLENSIGEKQALQKILNVLLQLQKYGVSDAEWNDTKKKQLNYLQIRYEDKAKYWIDEIMEFYTRGEALPENKNAILISWLSNLSLSEFNGFVSQFLSKKPEDIGILAPSGHQALSLTENEVRSWIQESYQEEVKPYEKPVVPTALMSSIEVEKLKKQEIIEYGTSKIGAQEFTLNNGIRLIFKQIEATSGVDQDKIKIHGYALKGANCFPEKQFFSAVNAPSIISFSGLNGMNKLEINRFLEKSQMLPRGVVSSYIGMDEVGIQGTSSLANFEIVLQLIYLNFTSPNKSKEAFQNWKRMKYKTYEYQPSVEFGNAMEKSTKDLSVITTVFGRKGLESGARFLEGIEKINLDQAYEIFRSLFGNADDFTFVISGDFEIESVLPLVGKYLGNLPNSSSPSGCSSSKKKNIFLSNGPRYQEFIAPGDNKLNYMMYNISFLKKAPTILNWQEQLKMEALAWITTEKAWRLRYQMGLELYNVRVWGMFNKDLNRYEISSTFKCVPEEYPIIRAEMHDIISEMKSGHITEELFQQGMYAMHLFYDLDKRGGQHRKQHQNLYEYYRYDQPWMDPAEVEEFVNSLTIDDVVEAANKYYKDENLYEFVMKDNEF